MSDQKRVIEIDGEVYDVPTNQGVAITNAIMHTWKKLGKPTDIFTPSGKKLMTIIIATWEDTYPQLSRNWKLTRQEHLDAELTIKQQVKKKTGRNLAAYPMFIYKIIKIVFTDNNFKDRETTMKMVKEYPIFRHVNRI